MRLQKKYKKFSKLMILFNEFPSRLLKFCKTKWKKIKQTISKKKIKSYFWSAKVLLFTKKWIFYKFKYNTGVQLKKYFDCLFDRAFSLLFFKNLKYLNKNLDRISEISLYLIKPEFRLDIFLWRLNLFSSCYQARQVINNSQIKINARCIHPNYFLQKGDIIFFPSELYHFNANFRNFLSKKLDNIKLLTFIEFDYYTNTFIILKNYNELTKKDMMFFLNNTINITQYKLFIE